MKLKVKKIKMSAPMEIYPEFTLDEMQLPEIKDWEVGKKYSLEVQVEMTGLHKPQYSDSKKLRGTFKVTSVQPEESDKNEKPYKK